MSIGFKGNFFILNANWKRVWAGIPVFSVFCSHYSFALDYLASAIQTALEQAVKAIDKLRLPRQWKKQTAFNSYVSFVGELAVGGVAGAQSRKITKSWCHITLEPSTFWLYTFFLNILFLFLLGCLLMLTLGFDNFISLVFQVVFHFFFTYTKQSPDVVGDSGRTECQMLTIFLQQLYTGLSMKYLLNSTSHNDGSRIPQKKI